MSPLSGKVRNLLDSLCPYFTRFPLSFPLDILKKETRSRLVLDPFCGCGTTLLAARLTGHRSLGTDIHPVAVALSRAKLARTTLEEVLQRAKDILSRESILEPEENSEFFECCFHPEVLKDLQLFRQRYHREKMDDTEELLYGILLGILHGPVHKGPYLSNSMPASFSPSQEVLFARWRSDHSSPPARNILQCIAQKAYGLKGCPARPSFGQVEQISFDQIDSSRTHSPFDLIITSPPYFGLSNLCCGQWLRSWLLRENSTFPPSGREMNHTSLQDYTNTLAELWQRLTLCCREGASLWLRFGKVPESGAPPTLELLDESLTRAETQWIMRQAQPVDTPLLRPSCPSFESPSSPPEDEWIIHLRLQN